VDIYAIEDILDSTILEVTLQLLHDELIFTLSVKNICLNSQNSGVNCFES
jgi:hypothetical protein